MTSRSTVGRSHFVAALVAATTICLGMGAATAAAQSPQASTGVPQEITETGALLTGFGASNTQAQTFSYVFQYGTTTAYGQSTPVAQASNGNVSQRIANLANGTEYHFRIVVQDANGTAVGQDQMFMTVKGPPPYVKPPGATTFSDTVGPGGSVSTGSTPSSSDPIEVKVTAEKGGKIYIDKIKNPKRPPDLTRNDEDFNPEDPGAINRDFYGPALRISTAIEQTQRFTVVFTIDGGTNLTDGFFQNQLSREEGINPVIAFDTPHRCEIDPVVNVTGRNFRASRVHYLANGDVQLTHRLICYRTSGATTFHFFNRAWSAPKADSTGPGFNTSLNDALAKGYLTTDIACFLKCSRSSTATISSKAAKALKLRSTTLATASKRPNSTLKDEIEPARKGAELRLLLSTTERRALKRANRITVTFQMKAVGPDGQVWKKTAKLTLKKDEDEDSIN